MTFLEAARSGKRFRRPGFIWSNPLDPSVVNEISLGNGFCVSLDGLAANDWEVEESEPAMKIFTRSEFIEAFRTKFDMVPARSLLQMFWPEDLNGQE